MTLQILQRFLALVSLALAAVGGYLAWSWWELRNELRALPGPIDRLDTEDWRLWVGAALLAWWLLGRLPLALTLGRPGRDGAWLQRGPASDIESADGAVLRTERSGPADAPLLVMIHGWGMERRTWNRARAILSQRYEVAAYDLAGLGQSKAPPDRDYGLERLSDQLLAVLEAAGRRKVVLVGHSIGGMIVQTFCRRHAALLGERIAGIVLVNTTHEDPTRTMILGPVAHAMKPLLIAMMWLDIVLEPLAWLLNWQSYLSGSTHLAMRLGGFGARPTRSALELVARDATTNRPAIQARGNIAMMKWRATEDLPAIDVPALVFIGGRDIVTLPSAGEAIARRLPQAQLARMPQAGHLGPIELADDYAQRMAAFADEVFTRGAVSADAAPSYRPAGDGLAGEPRGGRPEPRPFA
jgi:pimeloyl-ACP methyl ester carboxylesterase